MKVKNTDKSLINLRRKLHSHPDLSWYEQKTAGEIFDFLSLYEPDDIITEIAGTGLAAVYNGKRGGPTLLVRCELDALPIDEINDVSYRSVNPGCSHKCGHDGHMTIIAGLAAILSSSRPNRGKVVLLFQPAEERGEGAARVIEDKKFNRIKPDYTFSLHNLPGFDLNSIVLSNGIFASASSGMAVELSGKTSHAAEPERGKSPALAMADIVKNITLMPSKETDYKDFVLSTVVFAKLGEIALGTSPGYAKIITTLRAFREDDMKLLSSRSMKLAENTCGEYGIDIKIDWMEEFPSTVNDPGCVKILSEAASLNGFNTVLIDEPFRWSEDFGHFTKLCPGAMFGIGAGRNHPRLHNPDYDFPEEIIPTGIKMFSEIINLILSR
ncbi:MAG: amidohydrolase [Candidatus Krumholzibacteriota bacterium]|nr:amidohydrolase [Candidatus Krumholzibacteriota bacterium]